MKLTNSFKQQIIQTIRDDGTLRDAGDWWTSYVDEKGRVFDINVYDDEFGDCAVDEVCISVYDCYEDVDGHWYTDYENSPYESFIIKRSEVAPMTMYKLFFTMSLECSLIQFAYSEQHAIEILEDLLEQHGFDKLQYVLRESKLTHVSAKEL